MQTADVAQRAATEARRLAGEARARASAKSESAESTLTQRTAARAPPPSRALQHFADSGLLSAALPDIELPDLRSAWTIDPALTLARRTEQALAHIKRRRSRLDPRAAADRRRSAPNCSARLSALGHQAPAEPSDWGFVVHIIYQNRPERPDQLALRLADEIAQRSELLTAKEREVLENHLQAEIAAEMQRLLQAAETQRDAINQELHKRPTSTGVRYRLLWQTLGEEEGAPVGLEAARKRLLNTSADLWSAEDRRVVGTMLQQRIAAERERADAEAGRHVGDGGGSLVDQLARALDYRRWHRFRVERWQDGQWRKLSGPASSGERALGLTVPLFAAVASFYSQGSYAACAAPDAARRGLRRHRRCGAGALHGADPRVRPRFRDHQRTRMGLLCRTARRRRSASCSGAKASMRCTSRAGPGTAGPRRREDDPDRRFAPA